ncbi:hypothetical protein HMPREF9302_03960 [Prevotella amnii DNF00058]|uniref:Transcriptional regulator n=1 Tax=Prevotella amnii DNF00058 TaxID=1401066 RepID=A0A096B0D6_9BACT|nr:hypothetical protein HMPREF9302_03960 [Prevotella amnii DNF00058]
MRNTKINKKLLVFLLRFLIFHGVINFSLYTFALKKSFSVRKFNKIIIKAERLLNKEGVVK